MLPNGDSKRTEEMDVCVELAHTSASNGYVAATCNEGDICQKAKEADELHRRRFGTAAPGTQFPFVELALN